MYLLNNLDVGQIGNLPYTAANRDLLDRPMAEEPGSSSTPGGAGPYPKWDDTSATPWYTETWKARQIQVITCMYTQSMEVNRR